MPVKVRLNYLRIAPRKVQLVVDLIRGRSVDEALTLLDFINKKAAKPLKKLLNSAVADARHNFQLDQSNLYIFKALVDEGPTYKRWMARARGQADEIKKRTSHVTLVLAEREGVKKSSPHKGREVKPKSKVRKAESKEVSADKEPKEKEAKRKKPEGGRMKEREKRLMRKKVQMRIPRLRKKLTQHKSG